MSAIKCSVCKVELNEETKVKKYNRCIRCHTEIRKKENHRYKIMNWKKIREKDEKYREKNNEKIKEEKRMKGLTEDDIKNINFKWEKLMEYTKDWGDFSYEQKYKDEKTPKQKQRLLIIYEKSQQSIPW